MERDILLLGNPRLYEISEEVKREELEELRSVFTDMFDCIRGNPTRLWVWTGNCGTTDWGTEAADLYFDQISLMSLSIPG